MTGADVYKQGRRAAMLTRRPEGVEFRYTDDYLDRPGGGAGHILKLNPPEVPALVENEAFLLATARRSGLRVAEARLVTDAAGASGLLVTRFDRGRDRDSQPASCAFEDGCQVLGRYPADKYAVTAEQVAAALCAHARSPLVAARELVRQLAFAYLSGNGDAHAKNLVDDAIRARRSPWSTGLGG